MRIQILPLPPVTLGDATETPFVLCIDQLEDFHADWLSRPDVMEDLRERWGARLVVINGTSDITISPNLELPDELQQQLIAHLTATTKEPTA